MFKAVMVCAATLTAALLAPALARADIVTDWNLNATNALMVTAGQPPQVSVPHMAMVHGAVYDAVVEIKNGRSQALSSVRGDGTQLIKEAKFVASGNPTPILQRCN